MVSYEPVCHATADKELNNLADDDAAALRSVLKDVATCEQPSHHEKAKPLEGQDGLFRVRVGDTRAICELDKPNLIVWKVGPRTTVYDAIDDIDDRRMTA